MGEYKEFPRAIYHVSEEPLVVNGEEELEKRLSEGWSKVPFDIPEDVKLQQKIDYYKKEVAGLEEKLNALLKSKEKAEEAPKAVEEPKAEQSEPKKEDARSSRRVRA